MGFTRYHSFQDILAYPRMRESRSVSGERPRPAACACGTATGKSVERALFRGDGAIAGCGSYCP